MLLPSYPVPDVMDYSVAAQVSTMGAAFNNALELPTFSSSVGGYPITIALPEGSAASNYAISNAYTSKAAEIPNCLFGRPAPSDWVSLLVEKVSLFQELPDNWDGSCGVAPTSTVVQEALTFISLLPIGTSEPDVFVTGENEVGFFWDKGGDVVEVSFFGDGNVYYLARTAAGATNRDGFTQFSRKVLSADLAEILSLI